MKSSGILRRGWITAIWTLTPTCAEMTRLSSRALESPLSPIARIRLAMHRLICVWCQRYSRQLEFLHHATPGLQSTIELASQRVLSEAARLRIRTRLRHECNHPSGTGADTL